MQAELIIGGVAAFGFLFLAIGGGILISQFRFARRAATTQGTVTALRAVSANRNTMTRTTSGPSYRPTVRFTTAAGEHVEAEARVATNPPVGRVGKTVTVRYDPANPQSFTTTSAVRIAGCVAWAFVLTGGFIFAIAVTILIALATR